jgi:cell division protein FtsW
MPTAAAPRDGAQEGSGLLSWRRGQPRRGAARRRQRSLEHRILLTATMCLLAFGAVMVYSASSATTLLGGGGTGTGYLIKFVAFGAVGLVLMNLLARDGVARVQSITPPLLAVSLALVLAVHLPHIGHSVNGARRWLGPSMLQFQPSELLKLALVLYAATLLARKPRQVHDLRALRKPLLVVVSASTVLVGTEPDLGSAMVIVFTTAVLLAAAGIPWRKLGVLSAWLFAGVLLYALVKPYARTRLTSFLDPWAHASSSGFQAVQGQIAIGSGGVLGVGPGQSVQKIFYLPEAPTDFILAVVAEELGTIGVFVLLFLYGLIGYAGLRAARSARSLYSALIAVGVTALILSQAILNTFAVLGLAPLTGVPLPFVSYGSSSLVVMLAAMGLLLNVAAGATGHVRAVGERSGSRRSRKSRPRTGQGDARDADSPRWGRDRGTKDRDRRRRHSGARRARAGGR